MRGAIFVVVLNVVWACNSVPTDQVFPLVFRVIDDEDVVVPDTIIQLGEEKKRTNKLGIAQFEITGVEGESVQVNIGCPADWKTVSAGPKEIVLKSLESINGQHIQPSINSFICVPFKKSHVVVVKTNGIRNLPVQLLGKEVARTNKGGVAQFVVSGKVNEPIELVLNTAEQPMLTPQMPARQLKLPHRRRFLLFEQNFTHVVAPKKRRKGKRKSRVLGPTRL